MHPTYRLLPATVVLIASASVWGSDSAGTFEREVAAQAQGIVQISNINGRIEVTGSDRPAVSVKAELGADVDHVEVTSSGDHTVVRVIPRGHSGGHDETLLRVQVPKGSQVEVSAVSATVTSTGVLGAQRLKSVSGDVSAEIGPGDVE